MEFGQLPFINLSWNLSTVLNLMKMVLNPHSMQTTREKKKQHFKKNNSFDKPSIIPVHALETANERNAETVFGRM